MNWHCELQVESLLQSYDWIVDEKKYFGQPNTAYDFTANNPKEAEKRITKLQDSKDKLSKSVNMRAMNMLGKAEEQVSVVKWSHSWAICLFCIPIPYPWTNKNVNHSLHLQCFHQRPFLEFSKKSYKFKFSAVIGTWPHFM